ncbi:MAG: hydantoinase B/oxoprolinase family protein, partial [Sphingomonadaceae bacterium]|nr:hydantoinase B/oxoprolinase family protein [Sphingomonadaceae bacterium]
DHNVPKNAGAFRRVDVRLRVGSVCGIPVHPTSCSAATTNVADRVCAATQGAIAQIADGFGMAEVGAGLSPASGVVSGKDPRTGKSFINQLFLGATGGAATAHNDAWMTYLHAGNGGLCFIDSVELDELCQPIRVESRRLLKDTEGPGRQRGAPSLEVTFGPIGCDVDVAFVSDGTTNGPTGVRGGGAGGQSRQYLRKVDGTLVATDQVAVQRVRDGESIISITCGGGGYGNPRDRDPAKVRHDVAEGWISPERAEEIYGISA